MANSEKNKVTIAPDTIDWPATKHLTRLYKLSALAADMGVVAGSLSMCLLGKYPPRGVVYERIVGALHDRGLLMFKQAEEHKAA